MSPTQLVPDSSTLIIEEFLQSILRRVGWVAGRAWWRIDDHVATSSWVIPDGSTVAVAEDSTSGLDSQRTRFMQPALVPSSDVELSSSDRGVLADFSVDRLLVVDVAGHSAVDVRLVLIPPAGGDVTAEQVDSVRSAMQLVPTVFLQERSKRELGLRAHHDPLTGLLNRRGWERLLALRTATVVSGAFLFLDLDGFKSINDRLGHRIGDEVLVAVSRALSATVRPNDVVARVGGDEFVVFASDIPDADTALAATSRVVRQAVRDIVTVSGHIVPVSASTGVALWKAGDSPTDALAEADRLMYEAKRLGGGVAARRDDGSLRVVDATSGNDLVADDDPWVVSPVTVRVQRTVSGDITNALVVLAPSLASSSSADQASAILAALTAARLDSRIPLALLPRGSGWARLGRLQQLIQVVGPMVGIDRLGLVVPADSHELDARLVAEEVAHEFSLARSVAVSSVAGADLGALLLGGIDSVYLGPRWSRSSAPIVGQAAASGAILALASSLGLTLVLVDVAEAEAAGFDSPQVAVATLPRSAGTEEDRS
jgi:diguanylate cyclase (GGDEF)-like protein